MTEVVSTAALVLVGLGLVVALAVGVRTRSLPAALSCGFELWLAAGLLRLALPATLPRLGVAAAVVVLRRLLSRSLRSAEAARLA